MFKKTLIAATLAALSTSAMAASIVLTAPATPEVTYSTEGITSNDSVPLAPAGLEIVLAAEYTVGDILTISVAGGQIDLDNSNSTLTAVLFDANDTMVMGLLSSTTNSLTFRVTEVTFDGVSEETTVDGTLTLEGVELLTATMADTTVSYKAETSTGISLDTGNALDTAVYTVTADQFSSSITTSLNEVIDINLDRQDFVGATGEDNLVITTAAESDTRAATYVDTAFVIMGDFSFMDTDADGEVSTTELTAGVTASPTAATGGDLALNAAMTELSLTSDDVIGAQIFTFAVAGQGTDNPILKAQSFTHDVTVNYTDSGTDGIGASALAGSTATDTAASAGAWTLNGSQITFPYAPVGYDHIVTNFEIANSSSLDAEIALDAFDSAGNAYTAKLTKIAGKKSLTSLTGADIAAAFGLTVGTKLSLTITVNALDNAIKISGYSNLNNAGRMAMLSDAYEG